MTLTEQDIRSLKTIRSFVVKADRSSPSANAAFLAALAHLERDLPEAARTAHFGWPADRLTAEIERWRPAYRLRRTSRGYAAHRWLKGRCMYASRAVETGLSEAAAEPYRTLIRC